MKENGIQSEYALGGLSNQIFASKYTLFLMRKFLKMRWKKFQGNMMRKIKLKRIENNNYE